MGYLLTIEAPDASGKSTQVKALCEALTAKGYAVKHVRFPNYGSDACKPVEQYLHGALGSDPASVNAYAASTFFAVDRFFSYRLDWREFAARPDSVTVLDRYTTSNAIHQLAKIADASEREAFLEWLYDFEFEKLGLPVPDDTLFLDVPPVVSLRLLAERAKADGNHFTDIHEADASYLTACYDAAGFAAAKKGWTTVTCTENGEMLSIGDIHARVLRFVLDRLDERGIRPSKV